MVHMSNIPILLTRQQAAEFLGIDPKSFDKYIRNHPDFKGRKTRAIYQIRTS